MEPSYVEARIGTLLNEINKMRGSIGQLDVPPHLETASAQQRTIGALNQAKCALEIAEASVADLVDAMRAPAAAQAA